MTGKHFRLPTEAEWEYAVRGGNQSKGYKFAGSNIINEVAWYFCNEDLPHTIGAKQPNELGIYDMSGNVFEWCQDWYCSYNSSEQVNPTGPKIGTQRVLRGGSWESNEESCRITKRWLSAANLAYSNYGLRLVCTDI